MKDWILPLLRCPATQQALIVKDGKLHAEQQAYPFLHGIPCLYKSPGMALLEWGTKIQNFVAEESDQIEHLEFLTRAPQSDLSKQRLLAQHDARTQNLDVLKSTLHAFLHYPSIPITPSSQQIHSYFQLLFRDWCWDESEIARYTALAGKALDDSEKTVLILGSGAGGLSYRLAQQFPSSRFVSLEHNPFLALSAERLMQGETLALQDYSIYPKSHQHCAQSWQVKAPAVVGDNHQAVLASYPFVPFAPNSFDVIIAPWFFDILELSFPAAVQHSLPFLKSDGELIFFGPANLHKSYTDEQWCAEEITAYFGKQFAEMSHHQETLYYLDSPLNAQRRMETLLFVHGRKPHAVTIQPPRDTPAVLRMTPELQQHKAVTDTMHTVLSVIDGDINAAELAAKLVSTFGFDAKEAPYYAELFIRKISMEIYAKSE